VVFAGKAVEVARSRPVRLAMERKMPWRRAFSAERALPFDVLGPVDFFALSRLAVICFG